MTFSFGKRSLENLKGVHPDLVKIAKRALEITPIDFCITEGLRTLERQNQLVAAGASQTLNSRHLTGDAIDVAAYIGGKVVWNTTPYSKIADAFFAASNELKVPLQWGGSWVKFRDYCHFQLPFGHE